MTRLEAIEKTKELLSIDVRGTKGGLSNAILRLNEVLFIYYEYELKDTAIEIDIDKISERLRGYAARLAELELAKAH